jgi:hypothetical protein
MQSSVKAEAQLRMNAMDIHSAGADNATCGGGDGIYSFPSCPSAVILCRYFSHFRYGGLAGFLLSDWQVAPLMRYETGFPINPVSGLDNSHTGVGFDRPNIAGVSPYIRSGHFSKLYQWVNPARYNQNAVGTFGTAGHFSLRTPSYFDVDAAVLRKFNAGERFTIETPVEAFNVTNHPNFGGPTPSTGVSLGPNSTLTSSSFGRITTAGNPRILQGAIKLIF